MGEEAEYLSNVEIDDYLMTDLESECEDEEEVSAVNVVWEAKSGKKIPINQINYHHLKNIIKMLERKVPRPDTLISILKHELYRRDKNK